MYGTYIVTLVSQTWTRYCNEHGQHCLLIRQKEEEYDDYILFGLLHSEKNECDKILWFKKLESFRKCIAV